MLSKTQEDFLTKCRVAHLATADGENVPHVVPVCFALAHGSGYISIDEKPKQRRGRGRTLKRIRNLIENPTFALVADRYDEDWSRLGWVMLRGRAQILESGAEHALAQSLLCRRYPQYRDMQLADLPVIALRIEKVSSWGNLDIGLSD